MATLNDLIQETVGDAPSFPQGTWFAKVVAPVPVSSAGFVWVVIPEISNSVKWGPYRWAGNNLPNIGSDAVVIFDNRQNGWVMIWP